MSCTNPLDHLKTYARPVIGHKPVNTLTTEDILQILKPIWLTKTETAKRVQARIENILDYAIAYDYFDGNNPARWKHHLDKILPNPSKIKAVQHHPAMPYRKLPAFMAELELKEGTSANALQFLILTACRSKEVLHATWEEIDLEAGIWTIPAKRMKMRREHRVPLSTQAIALIKSLPRKRDTPYLYPGARKQKPFSNMVFLQRMRRMNDGVKRDYVPHGFRSSFCDWANEVANFPSDVKKKALAHKIKNKTEAAYRRGDLFDKRRQMMQEWADYLLPKGALPLLDNPKTPDKRS